MNKDNWAEVDDVYNAANSCSNHPINLDIDLTGVTTIFGYAEGGNVGGSESNSWAIGILRDGRILVAYESSDYTGHG